MSNSFKLKFLFTYFILFGFLTKKVFAMPPAETPIAKIYTVFGVVDISGGGGIGKFVDFMLLFLYGFAGAIGVLLIIIGGVQYMTSQANYKQVQAAKQRLLYVVYGLVIVFISFFILNLINPEFLNFKW